MQNWLHGRCSKRYMGYLSADGQRVSKPQLRLPYVQRDQSNTVSIWARAPVVVGLCRHKDLGNGAPPTSSIMVVE